MHEPRAEIQIVRAFVFGAHHEVKRVRTVLFRQCFGVP
jgi:hypothetical protein